MLIINVVLPGTPANLSIAPRPIQTAVEMHKRKACFILLPALFILCESAARPQSCTPAPSGLVDWWTGDTNENDLIGVNNPEATDAVTLAPGEVKDGFTFGTHGYIEIAASSSLSNPQFTWAAWVEPDGPGPNNDASGSVIVANQASNTYNNFSLQWSATGKDFIYTFGNDSSELIQSPGTFPSGAYYFVAGTYDGRTFRLYVNGNFEGGYEESKTITYDSYVWMIGSTNTTQISEGYPRTWNGVIDEVQAYNVALSATQLQTIYNAGSGGVCKGLAFSPNSLTFARVTVGKSSPPLSVTASNNLPIPFTVETIKTSSEFAQTTTVRCPGPPCRREQPAR